MEENEDKKHETHPMEATDLFLKSYLTSKLDYFIDVYGLPVTYQRFLLPKF